ncbi:hypothetical protein [Cytobacillus dafuensis]|uniref:YtzI protein n=1 Tax=Cytobacillus dafuensis TaxID=1742359 RepID=A0A5B8YZA8_CYTDA|nr:hypothetical protein [Cytobacillus dafuensis]QED46074.1 hypothetical protein FSZ17_01430 [Cytobacillus dafuensis]
MTKFTKWADMETESKIIKCSIGSVIFLSIVIAALVLFMIANFLFKIYFLDYRFDDGELEPPIEQTV